MFSLREGAEGMNPIDDSEPVSKGVLYPKSQPILHLGEWMTIMQALKRRIDFCMKRSNNPGPYSADGVYFQKEVDFYLEELRITKLLYAKLKEAGFSES